MYFAISVSLLLVFILISNARSENSSELFIAKDSPEHVLCGIDPFRVDLNNVMHKFGKPTRVEIKTSKDDPSFPQGGGEKEYVWVFTDLEIHLYSGFYTDEKTGKVIETLETGMDVKGLKPSGELGETGKGLALGDSYSDVIRIYGKRVAAQVNLNTGYLCLEIQWKDRTHLSLYFDKNMRIDWMHLTRDNG